MMKTELSPQPTQPRPFTGRRACFFMKTNDPDALQRNEFYRVDLQILEDLGFEVVITTDPRRVPKADVYFVWWWTWAFVPLLRAKLIRKPVVIVGAFDHVMPDGKWQIYPNRHPLHKALIQWALKNAYANVVCAEDQREKISQDFKANNLQTSPHVLDTELYQPGDEPREPFFLTVCWMHSDNAVRKCVATSIRAMAALRDRLPDHRLIVAGDKGDGYPALAQLVEELGVGDIVEFPGLVSMEEKVRLMQQCRAYLQPTLAEGFGVAILEAMSSGAPVIVSPVGGVPYVVGDCGLRADGMDVDGLAEAMYRLASQPDLAAQQSHCGRERAVREFSYQRRLNDFHRILGEAMN